MMLFEKHEITFDIPEIYANPFDVDEVDVNANFQLPDGSQMLVPAFYNQDFEIVAIGPERYGNGSAPNWKARFTPFQLGEHVYSITLSDNDGIRQIGNEDRFTVIPSSDKGFIRIDTRDGRFMQYDNGQPFIPIGHNVAWEGEDPAALGLSSVFATVSGVSQTSDLSITPGLTRQPGGLIGTIQETTDGNSLEIPLPDFEKDMAIKIKPLF